ncbi:hypothetical protein [Dyadobacter aurulentus]|uniref:hypothetical protein n=1 Tax=Dyadobacter sp. UC 10 TaxID=2605428 RepID=UPI0011F1C666|nr:hypothetical protein [Dyadobacter sp. UC 10]KAA0989171.1 hypothetical protein FXO21_02815 [Dyadobacter sp. UC 10]
MLIFTFLISIAFAFVRINAFLHQKHPSGRHLNYMVAFALSISLFSYLYYLSLIFSISYEHVLIGIIIAATLSGLLNKKDRDIRQFSFTRIQGAGNLFILVIGILFLTIRFLIYVRRWGDWDAFAIWTMHAKFLYYPEFWTNMFTSNLSGTHPDYPLMLPSLIAFTWPGIGLITPLVPIVIANFVFIAIPATIFLALNRYNYKFAALISLIVFALDAKFIQIAGSQYADTLLSFFILMTFVLHKEIEEAGGIAIVLITGFIAGSAMWVKNEGLLFFVIFLALFVCFNYRNPRVILGFLAGGILPLLALVFFKIKLAPGNDLVNSDRAGVPDLILDVDRYMLIIKHMSSTSTRYYWVVLLAFVVLVIRKQPFSRTLPFLVVSLLFAGYFAIYLITPNDLDWHLGASIDRLMHHVYPACIYLFLLRFSKVSGPGYYNLPTT